MPETVRGGSHPQEACGAPSCLHHAACWPGFQVTSVAWIKSVCLHCGQESLFHIYKPFLIACLKHYVITYYTYMCVYSKRYSVSILEMGIKSKTENGSNFFCSWLNSCDDIILKSLIFGVTSVNDKIILNH